MESHCFENSNLMDVTTITNVDPFNEIQPNNDDHDNDDDMKLSTNMIDNNNATSVTIDTASSLMPLSHIPASDTMYKESDWMHFDLENYSAIKSNDILPFIKQPIISPSTLTFLNQPLFLQNTTATSNLFSQENLADYEFHFPSVHQQPLPVITDELDVIRNDNNKDNKTNEVEKNNNNATEDDDDMNENSLITQLPIQNTIQVMLLYISNFIYYHIYIYISNNIFI